MTITQELAAIRKIQSYIKKKIQSFSLLLTFSLLINLTVKSVGVRGALLSLVSAQAIKNAFFSSLRPRLHSYALVMR